MRITILLSAVVTLCALCAKAGVVQSGVPDMDFQYDFSERGESAFYSDWLLIDGNSDGMGWEYSPWVAGIDGVDGVAACYGCCGNGMSNDDYLVSVPIWLAEGDNHTAFYARASYGEDRERIEILYGDTPEVCAMQEIGAIELSGPQWRAGLLNFNVAQSGYYHLVVRYCSDEGSMVCIDNVSVGSGYSLGSPDLRISRLLLPVSNCDLSDECRIGAVLYNYGTRDSEIFRLRCDINNGNQTFEDEFDVAIAPNQSKAVYFTHAADFADIGEYSVVVDGCCGMDSIARCDGFVSSLAPASLPLSADFSDGLFGDWVEMQGGTWQYDDYGGCLQGEPGGIGKALVSRCFEADKAVRVRIAYGTSAWSEGSMHIAVGKAGCDYALYRTVYEDCGFSGTKESEFDICVDGADHYSLVIVNDDMDEYGQALLLKSVTISAVHDHDVAIADANACFSPYTPIGQLTDDTPLRVTVKNRGLMPYHGLRISAFADNVCVGEAQFDRVLDVEESVDIEMALDLSKACVDDVIHLSIIADGADADDFPEDNSLMFIPVHVTSSMRSNEHLADYDLGIGSWGEPLAVGNVYSLGRDDVLTALEMGFSHTDDPLDQETEIAVTIYELSGNMHVGKRLFWQKTKRGAGGVMTVTMDPMLLRKGNYYFEVEQLSNRNMGLAYEYSEGNSCYLREGDHVGRIDNGLALTIRAIFDEAYAPAYDVAAKSIVEPVKSVGLYSSSQTISADIRNLGYNTANFSAICSLNGQKLSEKSIQLPAYESTNCIFGTFDMSAPGDYTIEVTTLMPEDEMHENDLLSAKFTAVEEQNPYLMDFEHCDDFDGKDEVFNPRWRTVDRNGCNTDGFWQYYYPHHSMPVGFIAFNPDMTVPSMTANGFEGFYAHGGQRFGAAFVTLYDFSNPARQSDVWLISPKLQLNTGSSLELYVKTRMLEWESQSLEPYQILISESDDDFDSFTVVGEDLREAPADEWEKVTVDLSSFDNKAVYLAIRYIGVPGENVALMVDDIHVATSLSGFHGFEGKGIAVSCAGDTVTVTAASEIKDVTVLDPSGRKILIAKPKDRSFQFSTRSFPRGVYIIQTSTQDSRALAKCIL